MTKAYQMQNVHVLGNFRTPLDERQPNVKGFRDRRPGMSPRHLELVRTLRCTVCRSMVQVDAHHLKHGPAGKERGLALKATDRWAVPLCRHHHDEVERLSSTREAAWFARFGIPPLALARALWGATGDGSKMERVLSAFKIHAFHTGSKRAVVNKLMAQGMSRAEAEEIFLDGFVQ